MGGWFRHGGWIVAAAALLLNVLHAARDHHLTSPPEVGDGVDYDSIGLNLARGRGFGYFRADPEWRAQYEAALADGRDQYAAVMLRDTPFEPTTYRPPLLPVLLAGLYATVGRHFIVWRVMSCALGAAAALFMFLTARRLGGLAAAWIAGGLFLIDPYQRHFSGLYLTEGLATFLIALIGWASVELALRPRPAGFVVLGVAVALAVLTRGIFIFLLPAAAMLACWRAWSARRTAGWRGLALFAIAVGTLLLPWWTRNCIALEAFMPLGAQGWINMPAGYNDAALRNGGNWDWEVRQRVYREAGYSSPPDLTKLESERHRAEFGQAITMAWIRENPGKLPQLFSLKIATLWGSSRFGLLLIVAAAVGLALARPAPPRLALAAILLAYTAGVGLTWATGGRFRIPMMPLVFILAADVPVALALRMGGGGPIERWGFAPPSPPDPD